jgi:hypothetical protein
MTNVVEQSRQQERPCLDALRNLCCEETSEETLSNIDVVADVIEGFCLLNVFFQHDARKFNIARSDTKFCSETKALLLDSFKKIESFDFVPKIELTTKVFFLNAVKESVNLRNDQFSHQTEELFEIICG